MKSLAHVQIEFLDHYRPLILQKTRVLAFFFSTSNRNICASVDIYIFGLTDRFVIIFWDENMYVAMKSLCHDKIVFLAHYRPFIPRKISEI